MKALQTQSYSCSYLPRLANKLEWFIQDQIQGYPHGGNMGIQVKTNREFLWLYEVIFAEVDAPLPKPILASACDFGFDIDQEELALGLLAPIPGENFKPSDHAVEADEFDSLYRWFAA